MRRLRAICWAAVSYTHLLKELERFTDFEFEFVTLEGDVNDQLVAALEKVKNGELDLMGAIIYDLSLIHIFYLGLGFKEFEVFPTLWGEWNPCQIYIMSLR